MLVSYLGIVLIMQQEPKPISFDGTIVRVREMTDDKQPKPLSFDNVTPSAPKPSGRGPGALSFDNSTPNSNIVQQSVSTPKHSIVPAQSIFADTKSSYEQPAIDRAKADFGNLYVTEGHSIDKQIGQLFPLQIDNVMQWGASALTSQREVSETCTALIRNYSQLRGPELIESVIEALQPATGFMSKVLGKSPSAALTHKPAITVLHGQLINTMRQCDKELPIIHETETRLLIRLAALSSVCDVIGTVSDSSLAQALQDRRSMLMQATNQSQLLRLQIQEMRKIIVDLTSQCDNMINVTMPGLELALAHKK